MDDILADQSRIAVIGGGPSGSFFSYFLLDMAQRIGLDYTIDIYESRDFGVSGPQGCNMCGGIVSESLVQTLALEGIDLPPNVIRRGIEAYKMHMDVGSVQINPPSAEKRIGALYRGAGPKGTVHAEWRGLDAYLLELAQKKGANLIRGRLENVAWDDQYPKIQMKGGQPQKYDLLAVATGVNSPALKLFENLNGGYSAPETTKTFICEYYFGRKKIEDKLGNSMHTFLLDLPNLEFAAIIPKGDYVTVCMLGKDIDKELIQAFFTRSEVQSVMPSGWDWEDIACQCMPRMNIKGSKQPFMNRIVFIGDSGVSRLYKDGIGSAYQTAKAAVSSIVFNGSSTSQLKSSLWPAYKKIEKDNFVGKFLFSAASLFQKSPHLRKTVLHMVSREQSKGKNPARMSSILWDMFTGSSPYIDIFKRMLHPLYWSSFISSFFLAFLPEKKNKIEKDRKKGILDDFMPSTFPSDRPSE